MIKEFSMTYNGIYLDMICEHWNWEPRCLSLSYQLSWKMIVMIGVSTFACSQFWSKLNSLGKSGSCSRKKKTFDQTHCLALY